jgi:hypothetical protein
MKPLIVFLLVCTIAACAKNDCTQKSLPKLLAQTDVPENGLSISNGVNVNISVKNAIVPYDVCDRETAGQSHTLFVLYSQSIVGKDTIKTIIQQDTLLTPSLAAWQEWKTTITPRIKEPGIYRCEVKADILNEVKEDNE